MDKVVNKHNVELIIGSKILIVSNKIGNKILANVEEGEELIITGFSDNRKIMYHNQSLALPVNSDVYVKIK